MRKSYEYYEKKLGISNYEVDKIATIIDSIEKETASEEDIRCLGSNGLKFCLCEGKYELFKKLISPFSYDDNGVIRYMYLLDAISLGLVEFIMSCPSSIMEYWALENKKDNLKGSISVEEAARDAVVLYPTLKKELLDSIYNIDKNKIMTIKIRDVLARQISGLGHPIKSEKDVIYYVELPVLYPCLDLFNKNIVTIANDTEGCFDDYIKEDEENNIFMTNIIIDYNSLDDGNKEIADLLVNSGQGRLVKFGAYATDVDALVIEVPCKRDETVEQVSSRMMSLINMFHRQDMFYGVLDDNEIDAIINNNYRYLSNDKKREVYDLLNDSYSDENIVKVFSYFPFSTVYYDEEERKFWISKYYYDKHREYLNEQLNFDGQGLK